MRLLQGPVLVGMLMLLDSAVAGAPQCQASIQGSSAVFFIENRLGDARIEWFKETSIPGEVEYMWTVTSGATATDGSFRKSNKRFSFMVIKRAGSTPSGGDLGQLLAQAVGIAWGSQSEPIDGAKVKIGKFRNGVILGTSDPATFDRLFPDRPKAVEIVAFLEAAGTRYSCVADIKYE